MRVETTIRVQSLEEERLILIDAYGGRHMVETSAVNELCLNEHESAQLSFAVQWLVRELGFPLEDVIRSRDDSFRYFMSKS
jgi:hypothetical protein